MYPNMKHTPNHDYDHDGDTLREIPKIRALKPHMYFRLRGLRTPRDSLSDLAFAFPQLDVHHFSGNRLLDLHRQTRTAPLQVCVFACPQVRPDRWTGRQTDRQTEREREREKGSALGAFTPQASHPRQRAPRELGSGT